MASSLPALLVLDAAGQAAPRNESSSGGNAPAASQAAPTTGSLQLKVRRLSDSVELVIEGAGMAPQLRQSGGASGWQGDLTLAAPSGLRVGPQRLSIPELGFQTITFDGSGSSYRIGINPVSGAPLGRPVVSADGQNLILSFPAAAQVSLPVARFNATQPGSIPQPSYAPPLQPRAVAPPLGDMAVGSMTMRAPGLVNVSGPPITMTMKNAPAKDVLMAIAQLGKYGFVWVENSAPAEQTFMSQGTGSSSESLLTTKDPRQAQPVTVSFIQEPYGRAVNAVALGAGVQLKLEGRTIYAGFGVLQKSLGSQLSKVYRLNQVSANSAADYLANLGAQVTKTNTLTTATTTGVAQGEAVSGAANSQTTSESSEKYVESYGALTGPLVGIRATTDTRLSTITLVGDPPLVAFAEQYLRQLDLRQRQVALSVKILDVTLANDAVTENSFAFRFGNNFIVNDNGQLLGAFGRNLPANEGDFDALNTTQTIRETTAGGESSTTALRVDGSLTSDQLTRINNELNTLGISTRVSTDSTAGGVQTTTLDLEDNRTSTSISDSQTLSRVQDIISTVTGRTANTTSASTSATAYNSRIRRNPALNYPDNSFYDFVRSVITSESTKILASPTLVLSENSEEIRGGAAVSASIGETSAATIGRPNANESYVTVGEQVVTSYEVQAGQNGAPNTCQPEFGIAGLTFGARISKIDDNGFVTFSMSPAITATTRQQPIQGCGLVDILAVRRLDTGSARVRDGQTLIMTGVISDSDFQTVNKWPILGDLPLVGQFFRSSTGNRDKRELVILVTPKIINDYEGGSYGYGYQPETRAVRDAIGATGF